jgi:chromosome segregation ATPase
MTQTQTVTVQIGDTVRQGEVIDLPAHVNPAALRDAIRAGNSEHISVDCATPQPVHEHVGYIHTEMEIRTRTALARAGRSRELTTAYDDEIATLDAEIETLDAELAEQESQPAAEYRRQIAESSREQASLREAVESARGRLQACRDHGLDTDAAVEELEATITELSERETATAAAAEQLDHARETNRTRRDLREKRLRLEDRRANLKREARASLVDQLHEEFTAAVDAVPEASPNDPFDAPPVVTALAVARIADLDAPVVLDCDRFDAPAAAGDWLDTPILYI